MEELMIGRDSTRVFLNCHYYTVKYLEQPRHKKDGKYLLSKVDQNGVKHVVFNGDKYSRLMIAYGIIIM